MLSFNGISFSEPKATHHRVMGSIMSSIHTESAYSTVIVPELFMFNKYTMLVDIR